MDSETSSRTAVDRDACGMDRPGAPRSDDQGRLYDILATVPGVVWEAWGRPDAASQRIDYVSDYVETMLGYTREEWLSTPNFWLTIVHPDDREEAGNRAHESFASGKGGPNRFRWITRDGRTLYVEAESVVIKDPDGNPIGMRGVTLDVTARKRAEEQLHASEQRYETTLTSIGDAVIATDAGGKITFLNPIAADLTGWSSAEAAGRPLEEVFVIVNEQTRQPVENPVAKVLREGGIVGLANHTLLIRRDGRNVPIDDSGAPIRDAEGRIIGVVLVFRDITERYQAETTREFLARSSDVLASSLDYEQTLQTVADLAVPHIGDWCAVDLLEEDGSVRLVAVAHVDPEKVKFGRELRASQPVDIRDLRVTRGLANVLRCRQSELYPEITDEMLADSARSEQEMEALRSIGFRSAMIVPMIARGRTVGAITFVATTESGKQYNQSDLLLAEGLASRAALAVDNARLFAAAQEELERRRKTEEELRASRAQLAAIIEGIGMGITAQDPTGKVVFANTTAAKRSGFDTVEEFLNAPIPSILSRYEMLDELGRPFDPEQLPGRRVLRGEGETEVLLRIRRVPSPSPDEETGEGTVTGTAPRPVAPPDTWNIVKSTPICDDSGRVLLAINFFHDITERRRGEEARRRLAAIVESSNDAIVSKDLDGVITSWNAAAERLYGWRADEAIGIRKSLMIPEEKRDEFEAILQRVRSGERVEPFETRRRRKDGTEFDAMISVSPIRDEGGRAIGASTIARDITERKKTEAALQQQQAALERQKSDIEALNSRLRRTMQETHHRVKNNLQVIAALIDMQLMEPSQQVRRGELERIAQHIRALAAIHDLLTQEAKENGGVESLRTREAMDRLMPSLQAIAGPDRVTYRVADIPLPIRQATALAVIVNELVSNAVKHGEGNIAVELTTEEKSICLAVCDEGPGFPDEFDVNRSGNTGLELIENLGRWDLRGSVFYENLPGRGARVAVTFPIDETIR